MKNNEITALSIEELRQKLASEQENLRKLRFAHQVSAIESPMKLKETKN